jgi:hypothetical protein
MTRVIRVILIVHATLIELMISHYFSIFGVKTLIKLDFSSVSSPMIGTERPKSPERALNGPAAPRPKPSCQKASSVVLETQLILPIRQPLQWIGEGGRRVVFQRRSGVGASMPGLSKFTILTQTDRRNAALAGHSRGTL